MTLVGAGDVLAELLAINCRLGQSQAALAPNDPGQFLHEVPLSGTLRRVLRHQCVQKDLIFASVFPWQERMARQHSMLQSVEPRRFLTDVGRDFGRRRQGIHRLLLPRCSERSIRSRIRCAPTMKTTFNRSSPFSICCAICSYVLCRVHFGRGGESPSGPSSPLWLSSRPRVARSSVSLAQR